MRQLKKLLNVGGNNKDIPIPGIYANHKNLLLDIDPTGSPDIVCDARNLKTLQAKQFDVIYCSHNLEHYYRHDVRKVLAGFKHVLKEDGYVHILVPDMHALMRTTLERNLDIDDILYVGPSGPIMVHDVIYGWSAKIEQSGEDFFAHKTGFTEQSLANALILAGFQHAYGGSSNGEIRFYAFVNPPDAAIRITLDLPPD